MKDGWKHQHLPAGLRYLKACFGLLKRAWEKRLQQRINEFGMKQSSTWSKFVNELCAIW